MGRTQMTPAKASPEAPVKRGAGSAEKAEAQGRVAGLEMDDGVEGRKAAMRHGDLVLSRRQLFFLDRRGAEESSVDDYFGERRGRGDGEDGLGGGGLFRGFGLVGAAFLAGLHEGFGGIDMGAFDRLGLGLGPGLHLY